MGNRQYPHVVRRLSLAAHLASVNLPQLRTLLLNLHLGALTPQNPSCYHVLLFWLPLDPPESPSLPT